MVEAIMKVFLKRFVLHREVTFCPFFVCWKRSFFVSFLFPNNWNNKLNNIWNSLWYFPLFFFFHFYPVRKVKIVHWCSGLKALGKCLRFFFSRLTGAYNICSKGSSKQSVSRMRDNKRQNRKDEELESCVYALRNAFSVTKLVYTVVFRQMKIIR